MSLFKKIKENLIKKYAPVDKDQQSLMAYDIIIKELVNFRDDAKLFN